MLTRFKKLNKFVLTELMARERLINEYKLITSALILQKELWLNNEIKKLGLDNSKSYSVEYKSGRVIPIQEEFKATKK